MRRGTDDGLLMVFTDINILFTVAALLVLFEVLQFVVSGFGLAIMCIFAIIMTVVMCNSHYIDGGTAFCVSLFIGLLQFLFIGATVEVMVPINIWWFYYPVFYLTVWIFEGSYLLCRWGKRNDCKG